VRIIRWDRERSGRLVLARGWRRVVATVPPEQREAVEAVLQEKVGKGFNSRTDGKRADFQPRSSGST